MTEAQQQARIDNVRATESGNKSFLRRIRDYPAGQAIYNLGDYPEKVIAKLTDYDRKLIQKMAETGVSSSQLHKDWNDVCRLYGGDKFNAVDREGMKNPRFSDRGFMLLCVVRVCLHEYGPVKQHTGVFSMIRPCENLC